MMFWEASGIGSEVIGSLWNLSVLECTTGSFVLYSFPGFVSFLLSTLSFLLLLLLSLSFMSLIHKLYTTSVPGSTINPPAQRSRDG